MDKLKNKVIIISGGNGLLGKELIAKISDEGAICVNIDINHETNGSLTQIKCDITNPKDVKMTVDSVFEKYNRIDGLINNAYPRTKDWGSKFEDINYQSWQKNVDMQLNSYFYLTQVVSKVMVQQKSGVIINMASIYGVVGPDFTVYDGTTLTMPAAYAAIKGGLVNFSRYLASYLGPNNIRVNTISPGGIFDNQSDSFVKNYEKKVPMRRMGNPDDISPSAVFLLSDDSKYITGQNIIIDGGWTAI
ncbi:MAG TPA: oxidoreductase [Mucilaginibacter sp.]|jgi:NAD(P)-dependent dehydrogenase (short-subunit alcohol dehydrogenase family)|nr:oxidoreductase [Mucilaginibacter sp.]